MSTWTNAPGPLPDFMRDAEDKLKTVGISNARAEVQKLWRKASPRRYADIAEAGDGPAMARFEALVARRSAHEPLSQILERRAFWQHEFKVTSDVLDPRPDTETLVEAALAGSFTRVLDLGTGSGCILCSLLSERPAARGVGTDISAPALDVARENARRTETSDRATFIESDWFENVQGSFDLIVSNPPYIDAETYLALDKTVRNFEPQIALTPGGDGLDAYRKIIAQAPDYLTPKGRLIVEIGFDQAASVEAIFAEHGFGEIRLLHDLNDKPRVIAANKL